MNHVRCPSALLPSPPEEEGLVERGQVEWATNVALLANFPLFPTLSRKGRGGKQMRASI
jgi:hypothetical protein